MSKMDGPLSSQTTETQGQKVYLWLVAVGSLAGLLTAVASVITALKG